MSPTERPSWSAITIRTRLGGMIWASVPEAEDALRQSLQQLRLQQAEIDRDDAEEQAVGGQRERHRVAEQQKDDQRREHQRRQIGDQKSGHFTAVLSVSSRIGSRCLSSGSGIRPSRKPMRLMISDPP